MRLTLYVVHGSHPAIAVEKALQMKGLDYRVWEWPPVVHAPMQKLLFGKRTVPGLRINGERVVTSAAIYRRLDELRPEPPLYPKDPEARARVEAAERWGDEDFQQDARDIVWPGIVRHPGALASYGENSRLRLPASVLRLSQPVMSRGAQWLNRTGGEKARLRLSELPAKLDKIDAWIADGVIGDPLHPNAADLQILSTVRLISTIGDAHAALDDRPCVNAAKALFPHWDGALPAGLLVS